MQGTVELLVVEIDRAELGCDAALPPPLQVVLAHAAEPDGVRRHPELGEGADVEAEWRLPSSKGSGSSTRWSSLTLPSLTGIRMSQ